MAARVRLRRADIAGLPMVPPGVVAGGVNAVPSDPTAEELVASLPEVLRYVDESGSWSTIEVAINWNAPLVWVASYLRSMPGGAG